MNPLIRLEKKLGHVEEQMELDRDSAFAQLTDDRMNLHREVGNTIAHLNEAELSAEEQINSIQRQLKETHLALGFACWEASRQFLKSRQQIHDQLRALKATLAEFEEIEDEEALLYFKRISERTFQLEDRLDAIHFHCLLEDEHPREELAREREKVREALARLRPLIRKLAKSGKTARESLQHIGNEIRDTSKVMWKWFKILNYYEENERDREWKEREKLGPID